MDLEPKITSHLYMLFYNAVITGEKLRIWNKGQFDHSQECKVCKSRKENILHIYFGCRRINEFWKLICQFINDKSTVETVLTSRITVDIIFDFLEPLKNKFPKIEILYGLAIWNIYRAKTIAAIANTILPAEGIFLRWKNELKDKIIRDSKHPKKRDTWNKINNLWFSIEPGGKVNFNDS
ncbi:hypothetical protein AYI70_g3736 [Smittium culicis]|uniref:Reverse transcriptase zinc-binding domain-containing protein n=1 Tax=Smittium culicis TaxID=133412 RepID=A0A1R1Y2B7_9FUNG|nr:hypothetical protein AYI70_g3736 [Smittium culicis]